jgi:hypothetical protein
MVTTSSDNEDRSYHNIFAGSKFRVGEKSGGNSELVVMRLCPSAKKQIDIRKISDYCLASST